MDVWQDIGCGGLEYGYVRNACCVMALSVPDGSDVIWGPIRRITRKACTCVSIAHMPRTKFRF